MNEARSIQHLPQEQLDDMEKVRAFIVAGFKDQVMAEFENHPENDPWLVIEVQKGVKRCQLTPTTQHYYFARDDDFETPVGRPWYEIGQERWQGMEHSMQYLYDMNRFCQRDRTEFRFIVWYREPKEMDQLADRSKVARSNRERRRSQTTMPKQANSSIARSSAQDRTGHSKDEGSHTQWRKSLRDSDLDSNCHSNLDFPDWPVDIDLSSLSATEENLRPVKTTLDVGPKKASGLEASADVAPLSEETLGKYFVEACKDLVVQKLNNLRNSKAVR